MADTKTSALPVIGGTAMSSSTVFMLASANATANYQATPAQVLIGTGAMPLAGGTFTGQVVMGGGGGGPLIFPNFGGSYILSTNATHNFDTGSNIILSSTSRITMSSGTKITGGSVLPSVFQTDGTAPAEQVLSATSRGNLANFINNSSDGFGAIAYQVSQSSNSSAPAEVIAIGAGCISSSQAATRKMGFIEVSGFGADSQFPFAILQTGTYYGRQGQAQTTRWMWYTDGAQYVFSRTTTNPYIPDPAGGEGTLSLTGLLFKFDATASQFTASNIIGLNGSASTMGSGNAIIANGTSFSFSGAQPQTHYLTGNFLAGMTYGSNERIMLQQLWNTSKRHGVQGNLSAVAGWDMQGYDLNSSDGSFGAGTLLYDISGNGVTGTMAGAGASIVSNSQGGTALRIASNIALSSCDFGDAGNISGTAFSGGGWIARNNNTVYNFIACRATDDYSPPSATKCQYQIVINATVDPAPHTVGFSWSDGSTQQVKHSTGTVSAVTGTWVHVFVTYDGTTLKFYINGVLDSSVSITSALLNVSGAKLHIGLDSPTSASSAIADFAYIRIYSRVLLAPEILTLATTQGISALEVSPAAAATDPYLAIYAVGTAYSLTNASAALTFGTTSPVLTLSQAGTYRLVGRVNLKYNGATFLANRTVTLKLRRTNNTAADVSNSTTTVVTGAVATGTVTGDLTVAMLPEVFYAATAGDVVTLYGGLDTAPTAGSLDCTEASITAVRVGP